MDQAILNAANARSWRDIPQPVRPRAMSRGGRWRRLLAGVRIAAVAAFVGALAWGGWMLASSLRVNSPHMPAVAKSVPVRPPELKTTRDGVLDSAWLARTLALPPRVSLMELDLAQLRTRVLADGQVLTAALTRQFPDRLIVQVTERTPVARVRAERGGVERDFLVARDGVVFPGSGFDPAMIDSLPWLTGIALTAGSNGLEPIARMELVSQLLTDAQLAAEHLYRSWQTVSLARLESDRELIVTTVEGHTLVFNANGGFFVQLAKVDAIYAAQPLPAGSRLRIDLSLGREVPVKIAVAPLGSGGGPATATAVALPVRPASGPVVFPAVLTSPSKTKREL